MATGNPSQPTATTPAHSYPDPPLLLAPATPTGSVPWQSGRGCQPIGSAYGSEPLGFPGHGYPCSWYVPATGSPVACCGSQGRKRARAREVPPGVRVPGGFPAAACCVRMFHPVRGELLITVSGSPERSSGRIWGGSWYLGRFLGRCSPKHLSASYGPDVSSHREVSLVTLGIPSEGGGEELGLLPSPPRDGCDQKL